MRPHPLLSLALAARRNHRACRSSSPPAPPLSLFRSPQSPRLLRRNRRASPSHRRVSPPRRSGLRPPPPPHRRASPSRRRASPPRRSGLRPPPSASTSSTGRSRAQSPRLLRIAAPPPHRRECASGACPPHRRASSASLPSAHPPPGSLASACEEERFAGRLSSPFAEYFKDKWCSSPGTAFASLVRAAITPSTSLADLRRRRAVGSCIDALPPPPPRASTPPRGKIPSTSCFSDRYPRSPPQPPPPPPPDPCIVDSTAHLRA